MPALLLALAPTPDGYGVGLEWLVYVSFIAPIVLLVAVWWIGSRNTV